MTVGWFMVSFFVTILLSVLWQSYWILMLLLITIINCWDHHTAKYDECFTEHAIAFWNFFYETGEMNVSSLFSLVSVVYFD